MTHWPILPILIPLIATIVLLIAYGARPTTKRLISLLSVLILVGVAVVLLFAASDGSVEVYRLGNWPAPYGNVLVVDRLSAMLVTLMSALSLPVVLAAMSETDTRGRHFHALLQFQIADINDAFLTGDVFNMFVFFEILLLASYVLLVHGGGRERVRAGLVYMILNLAGSALFLVALGLLYGMLGTLNLADMALVLPKVAPEDQAVARTAAALLLVVFLLKAALFQLGFWLPHVYAAASMPVVCLFAIMTKVGIYCVLRLSSIGLAAAPLSSSRSADRGCRESAALPEAGALSSEVRVVVGEHYQTILAEAEISDADLVVVGQHRKDILLDLFRGSNGERIIRFGNRPVLIVKSAATHPYVSMLAAVDFLPPWRQAIEVAARLAPNADVKLVHAFDIPFRGLLFGGASMEQLTKKHQQQFQEMVEAQTREFLRTLPARIALRQVITREGSPETTVLAVAEKTRSDLLVVGTHRRSGLGRTLLGSVAEALLARAPCDVLAVRGW